MRPYHKSGPPKKSSQRILGDYLFIAPQFILYFSLTILPFIIAIPILFTDKANFLDTEPEYIGTENFTKIFTDEAVMKDFWPAFRRTVTFTGLNYLSVFIFGLTLALLMFEFGFNRAIFTVIYLPWMASSLAIGYIAVMLFSESAGTVNLILKEMGIFEKGINIKQGYGTTAILPFIVGWRSAGFNMAIFLSGLMSIPRETIEASIIDGANYWQRLTRIYFPQMVPSFVIVTIFCMIGSFGIFDELVAMGGLYQNEEAEFLSIIFFRYGFGADRLALGMTLALETFLPLVLIAVGLQYLQRKYQNV